MSGDIKKLKESLRKDPVTAFGELSLQNIKIFKRLYEGYLTHDQYEQKLFKERWEKEIEEL